MEVEQENVKDLSEKPTEKPPQKSIFTQQVVSDDGDKRSENTENSAWYRRWAARRRFIYASRGSTTNDMDPVLFFMCLCAIAIMLCGFGLTFITMWNLITKIRYFLFVDILTYVGANAFCLVGGIICLPCFWICWMIQDEIKHINLLSTLMGMLAFCLLFLILGTSLAISLRFDLSFSKTGEESNFELNDGPVKSFINETMTKTMKNYLIYSEYRSAWYYLQKRLKCCGITSTNDWKINIGRVPCSCKHAVGTYNIVTYYGIGCLDAIALLLCWEMGFLVGIAVITVLVLVSTLILTSYMYGKFRIVNTIPRA